jgi:subtilisin family serine protease
MKKLYPLFLFFLLPLFSIAQEPWKIPLSLYAKASALPPSESIGILVEGNPAAIADAAKNHGGFLKYNQGEICSVEIPAGELVNFSKEPGIIRIGNNINNRPLNDTMKVQSGVMGARNGNSPLPHGYKGNNIIIGMIDSGIDFTHPDFKDSLGNTRILKLWDQRDPSGPSPSPWGYGTLWDSAQINAGSCTHNDLAYYGHGTHVTGIAAGNGNSVATVDYSGVAPKADIIMVALDFSGNNSPVAVADAAAYIYQQAQALGRPCVINASVGDYLGSHDGQDLQALMIDSLLLQSNGRSFVTAVGNAGSEKIHLSYSLTPLDTNFTWFVSNSGPIYIQTWADTNNFNGAHFSIGCTQDGSFIEKGRTAFGNFQSNLNLFSYDSIVNSNGQRMAWIQKYGSIQGSAASMEFFIIPDSTTGYNFSLQMTGTGLFHCWSFDMYGNALPNALTYPKILFYKSPDTTHTVCSSFQCSDKTICVGNYVNRASWMSYTGSRTYDTTVVAGDIMFNSSIGPTRDGRIRPDITAPGANDISCAVLSTVPNIIASGGGPYLGVGGFHVAGGGSSASSPVVAGSVALYLEAYPNANFQEVKTAVTTCAHTDGFTGSILPDNSWGYGKVDAFSMLANCGLGITENNIASNSFTLYPNPVNGNSFQLQCAALKENALLEIYSVNGQKIYSQPVEKGTSLVNVNAVMSSGMYFVRLSGENFSVTQKLVVE